jgi:hypothetical protein
VRLDAHASSSSSSHTQVSTTALEEAKTPELYLGHVVEDLQVDVGDEEADEVRQQTALLPQALEPLVL